MMTDTTEMLISKTDTLEFLAKESYAKRQKAKQKVLDEWKKDQEKKKKKGERYDSIYPQEFLKLKISPSGSLEPTSIITFESPTPIAHVDTAGIHLSLKVDSTFQKVDFTFRQRKENIRQYELRAKWTTGSEYNLEIDSAAFADVYGLVSNASKQSLKLKNEEGIDMLLIGVRPDMQGIGINSLFFNHLIPIYKKKHFKWAETGPQLEDNHKELSQWKNLNPQYIKRRRCYTKDIL
jgi:hypothetical protein